MSRPKLSSPDQQPLIRWALRIYEFAASLSLAVVLIAASAFTLGLATFVEAAYGTPVVQFYVYKSWWFVLILALLAVNIFCAAAIRYPWKRHQTGFVITHIGLLTLLLGAYLKARGGIDAQVSMYESQMDKWAFENAMKLILTDSRAGESSQPTINTREIKFRPGLFNWDDWNNEFAFSKAGDENIAFGRLSWQLFRSGCGRLFTISGQNHPGDVLYDRDGVKLEVLDYYADSEPVHAPFVRFHVRMPAMTRSTAEGTKTEESNHWEMQELMVRALPDQPEYPYGWSQKEMQGGGAFTLQLAGSDAQTESFLNSLPEGKLGSKGQAVIHAGGKVTRISIDDALNKKPVPLAGGYEAEVIEYWPVAKLGQSGTKLQWQETKGETKPTNPAVKIDISKDGKKVSQLLLLALEPQSSIVDHDRDIYGEYWFDHDDETLLKKEERQKAGVTPRIDFLQGHDQKLYYRYWNRSKVVFAREIDPHGSREDAVEGFVMPFGETKLYVSQFLPTDKPQVLPLKQPFVKDKLIGQRFPAAKFAMTVDGEREEFWLPVDFTIPGLPRRDRPGQLKLEHTSATKSRVASLVMPIEALDIGFRVRLNKFERKLDPGTEQASHYASWVDFIDHDSERAICTLTGKKVKTYRFSKVPRPTLINGIAGDDDPEIYWTDDKEGEIHGALWVGSPELNPHVEADRLHKPAALAYPYYVDRVTAGKRDIGVIGIAKGGQSKTLAELPYVPESLIHDSENDCLYFASRSRNAIGRLNLKTDDVEEKWFADAARPAHLALDVKGQRLLWSEAGKVRIRWVKLDGSKTGKLLSSEQPLDLAVDADGERLYFMESLANPSEDATGKPTSKPLRWRLMSAKLSDGTDLRVECDENIDEPKSLAIVGKQVLWTQTALTRDDIWITMNAPVDCFDPKSGRSYRLFQERFSGPLKPGDDLRGVRFEDLVPPNSRKIELYESVLTVNYDPGRGIRNIGCLLICLGIGTMFYMRAYFFKAKSRVVTAEAVAEPRPMKKQVVRM